MVFRRQRAGGTFVLPGFGTLAGAEVVGTAGAAGGAVAGGVLGRAAAELLIWIRNHPVSFSTGPESSSGAPSGSGGGSNGLSSGQNCIIRSLRGLAKSKGWMKRVKKGGIIEEWGLYDGSNREFRWRIAIKFEPAGNATGADSQVPRFDFRGFNNRNMGQYKNPFAAPGQPGSTWGTNVPGVSSHIPL